MSHLKSCIEASNAVKNASDETVNSCFTQIVNSVFGGKRNLLRSLLSPQSNLKQHQIEEIKQIFHTKFQKLIETESDKVAMDIDQTSPIPTLITIPEATQTVITSFLDFQSINQFKNTCSSIAPVCITLLLYKMDIQVINVHELIMRNHSDKIEMDDIIRSSFKTHRVLRAHTLKSFVENETIISFDNLLCFKHSESTTMMNGINDSTTITDLKGSAFLFMDKALSPQSLTPVSLLHNSYVPVTILFVQEFDIELQSLRITDVVHPNHNLTFNDIKQMINNRIHQEVTLYAVSIYGEVHNVIGDHRVSASRYNEIMTIIYQRNSMSESAKEELKVSHYKQLKPFYESVEIFYERNTTIPGIKYNDLGFDLEENYEHLVPYDDIAKCFKKAYDLSPNHPPFISNYIRSLVQYDKEEHIQTAQQLFQQKLQLHSDGTLDIPGKVLRGLYNIMAQAYEYEGERQDKTALEYYLKAVTIIESELDKRDNSFTPRFTHMYSRSRDPYFEDTATLRHALSETYNSIACVYEGSIKYKQDKTAPEAEEYHLKMLEMQPRSAFRHQRYANYLTNYKRNYSKAIDWYGKVEELVDSEESSDWTNRAVFRCYGEWFDCLLRLERYQEAESMCLRWIERAQDSDKKEYHLKHAYTRIICLYERYLKQPEAAKLYSSMRSKLGHKYDGMILT
eukprot:902790_1